MRFRIFFIFFLTTISVFGQPAKQAPNLPGFDNKQLNFGFLIGFNTMNYHVIHAENLAPGLDRRYADAVSLTPGLNLGMVTNFRINKYFSLRALPGISFGQRDLHFIDGNGVKDDYPLEIKSTYLECPIMLKFNGARMLNAKPYLIGGINPRYDLAKSKRDGLAIQPFDVYWEIGAGIDSYLSYFRFATELKISVGMFNILNPKGTGDYDDLKYTDVLDKIFSRVFVLTFYFE